MAESYPQRPFAVPDGATEIVLVRHGASQHRVAGEPFALLEGRADPALAPEGREQAEAVCRRLAAAAPFGLLAVTPLRRTHETLAPLADRLGQKPLVVRELAEVGLGEWEGGELRVRAQEGDPLYAEIFARERWDVIPGAEPAEDFAARVRAGIDRLVAAAVTGLPVVAVVHGGVIGELCRQAARSRPFAFVHADNASISRLVVMADGHWLVRSFNDTAHLGPGG